MPFRLISTLFSSRSRTVFDCSVSKRLFRLLLLHCMERQCRLASTNVTDPPPPPSVACEKRPHGGHLTSLRKNQSVLLSVWLHRELLCKSRKLKLQRFSVVCKSVCNPRAESAQSPLASHSCFFFVLWCCAAVYKEIFDIHLTSHLPSVLFFKYYFLCAPAKLPRICSGGEAWWREDGCFGINGMS